MIKTIVLLIVLGVYHTPVMANGNLHTLLIELETLSRLVEQQGRKAVDDGGRWEFRYDLLQARIEAIITDINKHLTLVNETPKLERFNQ